MVKTENSLPKHLIHQRKVPANRRVLLNITTSQQGSLYLFARFARNSSQICFKVHPTVFNVVYVCLFLDGRGCVCTQTSPPHFHHFV